MNNFTFFALTAFFFRGGIAYFPLLTWIFFRFFVKFRTGSLKLQQSDGLLLAVSSFLFCISFLQTGQLANLIKVEMLFLSAAILLQVDSEPIKHIWIKILNFMAFLLALFWLLSFFDPSLSLSLYELIFVWGSDRVPPAAFVYVRFYEPFIFTLLLLNAANISTIVKRLLYTVPSLSFWTFSYIFLAFKIKKIIFLCTIFIGFTVYFLLPIATTDSDFLSFINDQKIVSVERRLLKLGDVIPVNLYGVSYDFDYSETFAFRYAQNFGFIPALIFYLIFNYCLLRKSGSWFFVFFVNILISANAYPISIIYGLVAYWKKQTET